MRGIEAESRAASQRQARFEQKVTRERVSSRRRSAQDVAKIQEREAAAAAKKELAATERTVKTQQRLEERNLRWRQQMRNRHFQQEERDRKRHEAKAQREKERSASRIATGVGRTAGGIGTALKGAAAVGAGIAGVGAANALAVQIEESKQASILANQAGTPELKGQLLKEARGVRGFTGEEALAGMSEFVTKTGDLDTARGLLKDLGDLALATGTDLGDLGATAGQAFNVLKDQIDDPVERMKQLKELMGTLAQQGNMGAVEIRDLAQDFGKLGAATRAFEGGAPELLRSMGAFAQIAVARGGAESSADASTAASRMAGDIVTHRDSFKELGVDIKSKNDQTKLRSPMEIIADVLDKTGGDIEKTSGLFGIESGKIFKGIAATYSEAEKKEKGSGHDAVMAEFKRFSGAQLDEKQLQDRVASRMGDTDIQLKENLKAFNTAIGNELLPTVTKLVPEFTKLIPPVTGAVKVLAKMVEMFADNPLAGIGAVIAGSVVKDIATAGVGDAIKSTIAGEGPGIGGAAALGATAGIAIASAIFTVGVANFETKDADMNRSGELLKNARESNDVATVKKLIAEQQTLQEKVNKEGVIESIFGKGAASVLDPTHSVDEGARKTAAANLEKMMERLAVLEKLGPAADKLASAADTIASVPAANRYTAVTGPK